jgi:hypothetical protein
MKDFDHIKGSDLTPAKEKLYRNYLLYFGCFDQTDAENSAITSNPTAKQANARNT